MNLKEFNKSHQDWCKRTGKLVCKRKDETGVVNRDFDNQICQECIVKYLNAMTAEEAAQLIVVKKDPNIPSDSPSTEMIEKGMDEFMTLSQFPESRPEVGSYLKIGTKTWQIVDYGAITGVINVPMRDSNGNPLSSNVCRETNRTVTLRFIPQEPDDLIDLHLMYHNSQGHMMWHDSLIRMFFMTDDFMSAYIHPSLQKYLVTVENVTQDTTTSEVRWLTSHDKVWLPSLYQLGFDGVCTTKSQLKSTEYALDLFNPNKFSDANANKFMYDETGVKTVIPYWTRSCMKTTDAANVSTAVAFYIDKYENAPVVKSIQDVPSKYKTSLLAGPYITLGV